MSRKSSADEGPLHSPRPSPCNETEKNKQTKHNRKNQKPNKEQQPNQNRGHCRRLGPYTVALPVAISHKVSLKPKLCASATLIQKTSKNQPKHGPKNGTAWRSHFWHRMHSWVKEQKKKHFHGPIFGTVWRYQKWDCKIAKSTAKADPCNKQKITTRFT